MWYASQLDGALRHGSDMVDYARSDASCAVATATRCHFFTHRYAKATEPLRALGQGIED